MYVWVLWKTHEDWTDTAEVIGVYSTKEKALDYLVNISDVETREEAEKDFIDSDCQNYELDRHKVK